MVRSLKQLSIVELEEIIAEARMPRFRVFQILSWVYDKQVRSYDDMTNIPKQMREQLASAYPLTWPDIAFSQESTDGSVKLLLKYDDGVYAETVGIPSEDGRLTVCVSSQSGCAMGCSFCATGKEGLSRSLFPGEIVDQVVCVAEKFGRRVSNVVVMGQGEPFANYENTLAALRILNHPKLLNIGARHIAVSTCGIIDGILRFAVEPEQFTLAISLHSAWQPTRDMLMPSMANQDLGSLRKAIVRYTEATGRRITFEYALMYGVNDSDDQLNHLVAYCRRLLCHVNLIPLNHVEGSEFNPPSPHVINHWNNRLEEEGIAASIRRSRGSDIAAACGQLASQYRK